MFAIIEPMSYMIRKSILYLWCLCLPLTAVAQYENLLHKSYAAKLDGYSKLYLELIALKDSVAIAHRTAAIKTFAKQHKDKALELEMDLFMAYHNIEFKEHRSPKCISDLQQIIANAEKEKINHIKIRAMRVLADYYWEELKNYELAFEQYILLEKEIDKVGVEDYPEKPRDLTKIGEAYYFFQDYGKAKQYFKKAINVPENNFNTMFLCSARNTLGLCYQQEKNYDQSDYYLNQIVQTKFAKPKEEWVRIATGNIGANYYFRKQYDQAIPLLEYDFNGATAIGDYGCAAGAATLLADIFRERGKLELAGKFIADAQYNIVKVGQLDRLRLLYPIMAKWYAAVGDMSKSKQYIDSSVVAFNRYNEKFSALKMLRAQQKVDLQKEQLQLADKQRKIMERNLMIAIATGLGVVLVLGYFILKRRQQATEIAKLKVESDLKRAQSEINLFINKINEQSKITEKFSDELKKLKSSETEERRLLEKTVTELRTTKILTDEDWLGFQQHFAKIYPSFIQNLKMDYPAITEAELRYLMLSKLQLSHKEMAQALGISPDAVRVTWNRVRKKLGGTLSDTPQSLTP